MMTKELDDETKYEFNVFARQLNKDLSNLMEYLRQQDKDNKPILYVGRHLKKVILPYEEYQKMCQRLEAIDNANPSEALECLDRMSENARVYIDLEEYNKDTNTIKQALLKAQEQEKVLEILKPDLRLVGNFLQAKMPLVDNDSWINIKEITNKKELEVLKKKLG